MALRLTALSPDFVVAEHGHLNLLEDATLRLSLLKSFDSSRVEQRISPAISLGYKLQKLFREGRVPPGVSCVGVYWVL